MKENDQFILDIRRMGINGEGIGFYNKLAIFVKGAIPGEGHDILITKVEKTRAEGKTVTIKHASSARKTPECPCYEICGGCAVMHIDCKEMLKYKRSLIVEALNRYTRLNPRTFEIRETIPSEKEFGYRNKAQLLIKKNEETGKLGTFMLKDKTTEPFYVEKCMVYHPIINELSKKILEIADELEVPMYLAKFCRGVLKYLVIRVNEKEEAQVCFVCHEKNPKIKELAKRTIALEHVVSVYENFNDSPRMGLVFGAESHLLEGEKYLIETLGNTKYQLTPTSFFKLNTKQAKNLYDAVVKACKLSHKETVLDAYSGIGAVSLSLARLSKEVIGIEYNKDAVEEAISNASFNKISNVKFLQGDVTQLLPKLVNDGICFDVIICDPPRVGLTDEFIETLHEIKAKRLVYVSSNTASMAKDIEKLSDIYQVNSITPVDMLPQTPMVESVVLLSKIEK